MTLDNVNEALADRNESDVPLSDPYWKILNSFRMQQAQESEPLPEPEPIEEVPILEPNPEGDKALADFFSGLN